MIQFQTFDEILDFAIMQERAAQIFYANRYAEQLRSYARAAGNILKQPVAGTWLYFLTPQTAVEVTL